MEGYEDAKNTIDKKFIRKIIHIFIIVVLFLTFFSSTINNFMLPRVKVITPNEGSLKKEIIGEGIIEPKEIYEFYTNSSLRVLDVKVSPGEWVEKGQIIMVLDKKELKKKLSDEIILHQQEKIKLQNLVNSDAEEKCTVDIQIAEKKLKQSQEYSDAIKKLYEAGVESKQNLEKAEINLKELQGQYQKLVIEKDKLLKEHKLNIENSKLELKLHQNNIVSLKDELNCIDKISTPVSGIVKELNFPKGSFTDSSKPLFKMTDASKGFKLKIPIDDNNASYLSPGDSVKVTIKSFGGVKLEGSIKEIKHNLQSNEKNFDIIIGLTSKELHGGEQAEINIIKKTKNHEILIPNEAIQENQRDFFVLVLKEEDGPLGKEYYVQKVRVFCDGSDNSKTSVTKGLTYWDNIVVSSDRPISSGDRVKLDRSN